MLANCFDKKSRLNYWEEKRREIYRAEICFFDKNYRFFLRIKTKSLKVHVPQNEVTQQCITPITEMKIKERAMQLVMLVSDRNRYSNREVICAFGLKKDNMLQKRKLYYHKYIWRCWESQAEQHWAMATHLNDCVPWEKKVFPFLYFICYVFTALMMACAGTFLIYLILMHFSWWKTSELDHGPKS